MNKEKERTYLIILSLLILSNEFFDISFDKLNLLGNEATVPEGFIGYVIVIIWIYFTWSFSQNYELDIYIHRKSEAFKEALNKVTSKFVRNLALKKINNEVTIEKTGISLKSDESTYKYAVPNLSQGVATKKGVSIQLYDDDDMGGRKEADSLFIPNKSLKRYKFTAYFLFMINGKEFRETLFPYILVFLVIFLFVLDFISWIFNSISFFSQ